jgi:uncharacterized protein
VIYVNYLKYSEDRAKVQSLQPAHNKYLRGVMAQGKLLAAGPFPEWTGGLYIYEAETAEEADALMSNDPYAIGGAIESYKITPWELHGVNLNLFRVTG